MTAINFVFVRHEFMQEAGAGGRGDHVSLNSKYFIQDRSDKYVGTYLQCFIWTTIRLFWPQAVKRRCTL